MDNTYIWQGEGWHHFSWDHAAVDSLLTLAKSVQRDFYRHSSFLRLQDQGEILVQEALTTSAIEGEFLDSASIRSSVARRLGLPQAGLPDISRHSDGLVEVLIDATIRYQEPLTEGRLFGWHAALFPTGYSGMHKIKVGAWRTLSSPMEVISGPMGKEKVHFEAPPSSQVIKEMNQFLAWWESPDQEISGILRAGIAHFWFVTIHPFEDGNGRITRAITDMALAQDEKSGKRLYSLSSQILADKKRYYEVLEKTQKGSGDITEWLLWFLTLFVQSIQHSHKLIEKSILIGKFYLFHAATALNERQRKVLIKLLDALHDEFEGGMNNKKYCHITKTSTETSKRDLKDLVEKSVLLQNEGGGRSTSYRLNRSFVDV